MEDQWYIYLFTCFFITKVVQQYTQKYIVTRTLIRRQTERKRPLTTSVVYINIADFKKFELL